jgi:hypothetical protein
MSYITKDELNKYVKNKIILFSHGGVGSEYLTKLLKLDYPHIVLQSNKTFKNSIVHFTYPPPGLKLGIYIFGDIYNSLLSQIPRHYDNGAKLINQLDYKHFYHINDLVEVNKEDPFNIHNQYIHFNNDVIKSPFILLKYGFHKSLIKILKNFNKHFINYEFKKRNNNFDLLEEKEKDILKQFYEKTFNCMNNAPQLIIRFPKNNYNLSKYDINNIKLYYKLPSKITKHYKEIHDYIIYNERFVNDKYGRIRIKKKNEKEFKILDFKEYDININCYFGGVEDPRYFMFQNNTYLLMNGLDNNGSRNMYLYNIEKEHFCKLTINNFDITHIKNQKNWIPYIYNNEIYFIYSLDELTILKVIDIDNGITTCIKGDPLNFNNKYKYFGSTQLIQWNYPNYIGFLHTRKPYYSVPFIFNVETLEIKYIGKPIVFDNPNVNIHIKKKIVQFPYDLEIKNDKILLSINFYDNVSAIINFDYTKFCIAFSKI